MHKKLLKIIVAAVIVLALPCALLFFAFALPPQYGETYLGALSVKDAALQAAEGPRIIVVGGSGAAFDLRSDLLEQELPAYRTVNYGLYAGLGTTVMLELVRPLLQSGDVVVFMPELNAQTLSDYFGAESMWQAADGHFSLIERLDASRAGALAGAFPGFAAAKARCVLAEHASPAGDSIYARRSFNAWGDMACPGRETNVMPLHYDPNMPLVFDPGLPTEEFISRLNRFAEECRTQDVQVFFRFCPMNRAALSAEEETRCEAFEKALAARLACPLLGHAKDALMDPEWFFDTNFHLNESGQIAATALLAADLKAYFGDLSPVTIQVPPAPAYAQAAPAEENGGDEACFLYRDSEEGCLITGLSEEGALRTHLSVPAAHGGRPVIAFDVQTFVGNTRIEEIRISSSIRLIEDGSFEGCRALRRIVMENPSPETCAVGRGLLSGTDADVIVPAESFAAYATGYFWSVHAARLIKGASEEQGPSSDESHPAESEADPPSQNASHRQDIAYHAGGGILTTESGGILYRRIDLSHLRVNTLPENGFMKREGYVLVSWNRAADGSGARIGLGSRTDREDGLALYAQWAKADPEENFLWEEAEGAAVILKYRGSGPVCVIPEQLGSLPVRVIAAGAFTDLELESLVLPSCLRKVEERAFIGCTVRTLTLFDSLREIGDASFSNCSLTTLFVNAVLSPVYSGSYYDTFSDKIDRLLSLKGRQKLILASGSSGRYGYDSELLHRAFPSLDVVNMGVYAYSNALPQLEIIRALSEPGDILLSAPEFDAIPWQFCTTNEFDAPFWAMLESNYDMLSLLDIGQYSRVFDSFAEYQRIRSGMPGRSYSISPANYDDDGNYYDFATYNRCGDFILPRPNHERDERMHSNIADYTPESFPESVTDSLNAVYRRFLADGITVFFSYSPRNRSSLSEASVPAARAALHSLLQERLCVPVISELEESLYSGVYFWKIDSHPSTEGCRLRTEQIIADLKKVLP